MIRVKITTTYKSVSSLMPTDFHNVYIIDHSKKMADKEWPGVYIYYAMILAGSESSYSYTNDCKSGQVTTMF